MHDPTNFNSAGDISAIDKHLSVFCPQF